MHGRAAFCCNTVLCVGDTYLLFHTLWGQGKKALLVATAKTKYINGHWKLESLLYRKGALKVWTRDEATANELGDYGVNVAFAGNPIMDLQCDESERKDLWQNGTKILILPGSRNRAYTDLQLVLGTLETIAEHLVSIMGKISNVDNNQIDQQQNVFSIESHFDNAKQHVSERNYLNPVTPTGEADGENHDRPRRYAAIGFAEASAPEKTVRAVAGGNCNKTPQKKFITEIRRNLQNEYCYHDRPCH